MQRLLHTTSPFYPEDGGIRFLHKAGDMFQVTRRCVPQGSNLNRHPSNSLLHSSYSAELLGSSWLVAVQKPSDLFEFLLNDFHRRWEK